MTWLALLDLVPALSAAAALGAFNLRHRRSNRTEATAWAITAVVLIPLLIVAVPLLGGGGAHGYGFVVLMVAGGPLSLGSAVLHDVWVDLLRGGGLSVPGDLGTSWVFAALLWAIVFGMLIRRFMQSTRARKRALQERPAE